LKNIKINAAFFIILIITIIPSCSNIPEKSINKNNINNDYEELLEILEQAKIYENFYIEGDENSINLKNIVEKAEKLVLSADMPDKTLVKQICGDFIKLSELFENFYIGNEKNKDPDPAVVDSLYINGIKCAYDFKSKTFYYTIGKNYEKELKLIIFAENKNKDKIFAKIIKNNDGTDWKIVPELNKEYKLKAGNNNFFYEYKIIFTMLPLIQIESASRIGDNYGDCEISITDPDFKNIDIFYFRSNAQIHIRGGISRGFPKKSYSIKFVEGKKNNDVKLFDLRKDSDWILDAMYIDKARMRNRVSTDIWHNMDSQLYFTQENKEQSNGTRGVFVEVFLNKEYMGLYCFTEKIDRKQLQLQNNENGLKSVIYKGKWWSDAILFRTYHGYDNKSMYWDAFEQMYPNPEKGGKIEWKPIANLVEFFIDSSDAEFSAYAEKYIDIQNFVDYTILLCISYAYDNTGKNAYWSCYDLTDENMNKIFLTPWDLDASWGQSWDGSKINGSEDRTWMDSEYEHDTNLFRRLVLTNANGFADKMRETWNRLKGNELSVENMTKIFDDYFDLFEISGAWDREKKKWPESGLNIKEEKKYIHNWIKARWYYINDFINTKLETVGDYAPASSRKNR